ncbi:DUF6332 family protein [Actinocorallia longicatena]|uniref:Secreted protein with PEP-CTERM sorting signal n=1 Tax=Actinocorallia longicatena TaxID=111803 RepID=A0ABP6QH53_9ACTN
MRHRTDPGALLAGLFFLGVAALFMVFGLDGGREPDLIVIAPAMAILLALVLLVRVLTRGRRRDL